MYVSISAPPNDMYDAYWDEGEPERPATLVSACRFESGSSSPSSHADSDYGSSTPFRSKEANPYNIPMDPIARESFFFQLLQDHFRESGHVTIPPGPSATQSLLRTWCTEQRKSWMKTLGVLDLREAVNRGIPFMTATRKKRLDEMNFDWGHLVLSKKDEEAVFSEEYQEMVRQHYKDWKWTPFFQQLKRNPQERSPALSLWCFQQQWLHQQGRLLERRAYLLQEIGFNLDASNQQALPPSDWSDIAQFLSKSYRCDVILPEILALEGKGCDLAVSVSRPKKRRHVAWQKRLTQLREFRLREGHVRVPPEHELYEWLERQRKNRKKLMPRSIQQLESLGFEFATEVVNDISNSTNPSNESRQYPEE